MNLVFILHPSSFILRAMPQRLAGTISLIVFATCLLIGGLSADNPFSVAVGRALVAMGGTFVVTLVIGLMVRRMLEENLALKSAVESQENLERNSPPGGR